MKLKQLLWLCLAAVALTAAAADDFTLLRDQWLKLEYPKVTVNAAAVNKLLSEQRPDGTFPHVNYEDTHGGVWNLMHHWGALERLALGYRFGSQSPKLREAVIRGIDNWSEKGYTNWNWWYQSIGIPLASTRVILIMGDALPQETLQKFRPILDRSKMGMTANNRLHLASIHFLKGVIYRDAAMVEAGREVLLSEIAIAKPGKEGLQPDFSYHQHNAQLQFGNYGLEYFEAGTRWCGVMRGTRFAAPEEKPRLMADYFLNGLRWVMYKEMFDIAACGRQIAGEAQLWKFQVARNTANRLAPQLDPDREREIRNFLAATGSFEGNRYFYCSDYLVHRRRDLFFSVKMCSKRVIGSESNNQENMLGRNAAFGVYQLLTDGKEYLKVMPLWNWRRLPGLTAPQDNEPLNSPDRYAFNQSELVGGISDGKVGATMIELAIKDFSFRKSYLVFDRFFAVIGGAIRCDSDAPVDSTVDSRWYRGPIRVTAAGKTASYETGTHNLKQVTSVIHDGLEYRFPKPADLVLAIEEKSADWREIQHSSKAKAVSGKIFTLYLEHGVRPAGAECAFLLIPAGSKADGFRLLSSGSAIHAGCDGSGTAFALFYEPGKVEIPGYGALESLQPAAVLIRNGEFTADDPLRKTKELKFRWDGKEFNHKSATL